MAYQNAFGDQVPVKRKFFNIVCVAAPIFSLLATIANFISHSTDGFKPWGIYCCFACVATCLLLYPLSKIIKNLDVIIGIVAISLNFLVMPLLYVTVGGITSGMTMYFIVGIVFSVLMLDNAVKGSILCICAFLWYGVIMGCDAYNVAGFHDFIMSNCTLDMTSGANPGNMYVDTFVDFIVCAVCVAVLLKVLARAFEKQQAKTDRLLAQMEELAVKDPLTGAYNRRFLLKYLESSMVSARNDNKNMAIVMFDIDKFKRINDDYGHLVGDEVIKALATTLMKSCRDYDIVSRYGGEEFVLVMPGASEDVAVARANQIREAFGAMKITEEIDRPVTVSGGVGEFKTNMKTPEQFIGVADDNLYIAKEGGRNIIVSLNHNHDLSKVDDPNPR